MPTLKNHSTFFASDEGIVFIEKLKSMTQDAGYHTDTSYSANGELYPDHRMPFVDKHMNYLRAHPATDPDAYLANLRLMTRRR